MPYLAFEPVSEKLSITRDGPTATLTFWMSWAQAESFAIQAVGGLRTSSGALQYFPPMAYESRSGLLTIYCNKCDVNPRTYDENGDGWEGAEVTLTFGVLDQPEDENAGGGDPTQVADYSFDLSAQELTLPKEAVGVSGGTGAGLGDEYPNPIKIVPEGSFTATFKYKPRLDVSKWLNYIGKVNSSTFRGHAAESVLFIGMSTKRSRSTDGKDVWSYDVHFLTKYGHTWNQIYNAEQGSWQTLDPKTYQTANFDTLLANL